MARAEKNLNNSRWRIVRETIHREFETGKLALKSMWDTGVLITKSSGEYHRIGLVVVIWKVITIVIVRRLEDSI